MWNLLNSILINFNDEQSFYALIHVLLINYVPYAYSIRMNHDSCDLINGCLYTHTLMLSLFLSTKF